MAPAELIELDKQDTGIQGRKSTPTRRRRGAHLPTHPVARGALIAVGSYLALRTAIAGSHTLRRRFLRRLLLDVAAALTAIGVTHWADFGCLLGLTRGGDLIPYDNDIAIAVLDPDWASLVPELKRRLEPRYSVKVVTPSEVDPSCGSSWVRVYCPLGMADLFSAYSPRSTDTDTDSGAHTKETNSVSMVLIDCGHGDTMNIPSDRVLHTGSMEWRGARLTVPNNDNRVLEWRYGRDWRTPRYMEKGADDVEGSKLYARVFRALAAVGIRV